MATHRVQVTKISSQGGSGGPWPTSGSRYDLTTPALTAKPASRLRETTWSRHGIRSSGVVDAPTAEGDHKATRREKISVRLPTDGGNGAALEKASEPAVAVKPAVALPAVVAKPDAAAPAVAEPARQ